MVDESIWAYIIYDTTLVKGQLLILIISGTRNTPEDYNPQHNNGVCTWNSATSAQEKFLELNSGSFMRAQSASVMVVCSGNCPGPLSGLTDGGLARTLDNHHSTQKKERRRKKTPSDVIGTEMKGKNEMYT